MKENFVTYEIALKLKEMGFDEPCFAYFMKKEISVYYHIIEFDGVNSPKLEVMNSKITEAHNLIYGIEVTAPLWQQAIDWFDKKGLYIQITPEFYKDGINWNWQIWWYRPTEDILEEDHYDTTDFFTNEPVRIHFTGRDKFMSGTMMYGDCHEYPQRFDAIKAALEEAIVIETMGRIEYSKR